MGKKDELSQDELDKLANEAADEAQDEALEFSLYKDRDDGAVRVVVLEGKVLAIQPTEFASRAKELLLNDPPPLIVLDMEDCAYLCSFALATLVDVHRELVERDCRLRLVTEDSRVCFLLRSVGGEILPDVFTTLEEALAV